MPLATPASGGTSATRSAADRPDVPETLSDTESKLVSGSLVAASGATVEERHRALGVRKLTRFPVFATLADRNVIGREGPRDAPTGQ